MVDTIDPAVKTMPADPVVIAPVQVAVIGPSAPQQTVTTPDHLPNIVLTTITPLIAIGVRFANVYLLTLLGLLGTSITGAIAAPDFLHLLIKCGEMALAPAILALGKDLLTVLTGLEKKFPLATGAV